MIKMTWRSIPEMLFQKYDHSAIEVAGKIYTIGGRLRQDIKSKIKKCEVFDPEKHSWSEIDLLPEPICSLVTFSYKDHIFCATGSSQSYFNEGNLDMTSTNS
jgi:N-acetylneuraminic acid mutarotase